MPAKSEDQRRAAAMALAAKRGDESPSKLRGAAKSMYDSMTEKELEKFASSVSESILVESVQRDLNRVVKLANEKCGVPWSEDKTNRTVPIWDAQAVSQKRLAGGRSTSRGPSMVVSVRAETLDAVIQDEKTPLDSDRPVIRAMKDALRELGKPVRVKTEAGTPVTLMRVGDTYIKRINDTQYVGYGRRKFKNSFVTEGKLEDLAAQFDPEEVAMGIEHEREHDEGGVLDVVKSEEDLLKIALSHLKEDPNYYTKLAKMEGGDDPEEAYAPSEYPQMRDPYRQAGFSYRTTAQNGLKPRGWDKKRLKKHVQHRPLGRKRPRLKENNGSTYTMGQALREAFLRVPGTSRRAVIQEQKFLPGIMEIRINSPELWDTRNPHDSAFITDVVRENGTKYGETFLTPTSHNKAITLVREEIKRVGLREFFYRLREATNLYDDEPMEPIQLRAIVKGDGSVLFSEHTSGTFEFTVR